MKRNFAALLVVAGASLWPFAGHTANTASENVSSAKQTIKENVEDAKITSRIKAALARDQAVSALNIRVSTENGVVKLTGNAKSPAEVDRAVSLAKGAEGVGSVQNEIQIGTRTTSEKTGITQKSKDALITTKVKAKLAKDADVSAMKIRVKTTNGIVHLSGQAKSIDEANKAVEIAQATDGVASVRNEINVSGTGATR